MNRAGRVALSIMTGFIVAVIIASAIIVAATQYQRASESEDHAARLQNELDATDMDLQMSEVSLQNTEIALHDMQGTLFQTRDELDVLSSRARACRYLVRVNDHLLDGMTAESAATRHLIAEHRLTAHRLAARREIQRSGRHVKAIQKLVKRGGYRTISGLVNACAPVTGG